MDWIYDLKYKEIQINNECVMTSLVHDTMYNDSNMIIVCNTQKWKVYTEKQTFQSFTVPVYSMVSHTVVNIPLLLCGHKKLKFKKA